MAKRSKTQLTADKALAEDFDSDEEHFEGAKRASADVLASRPIAKLKPRVKPANGFAAASKPAGAFSFLTPSTDSDKPTQPETKAPETNVVSDQPTQLKSLNALFLQSINNSVVKNPIADLRPILTKYQEYYDKVINNKIAVKNAEVPKVDVKVDAVKNSEFKFGTEDTKSDEEDEEDKPVEIKGPAFTLDALPKSKDYGFKFGRAPPPDSDSDDDVKIEGPTFQLSSGTQIKDDVFKFPKKDEPAAKPTEQPAEQPAEKPAFTFGQSKPAEAAVPAFSFGKPAESAFAKPAFSFNAPAKEEPKASEPEPSSETASAPTPAFSFGSSSAFSFSKPSETKPEAKDESQPAKPVFSFSAPSNGFNFGASAPKPAEAANPFSFGSTPAAAAAAPATSTFNFNFSAPKTEESKPADTDKPDEEVEQNDDVKGDFAVVKLSQKVDTKTGEENETVVYSKKSKILQFDAANKDDPYKSIGLGELKVLKNTETGKARILVRSEGGMNVILNVAILKDLKYELIGKGNSIRLPTFTADGKLETYIARVKTADDGKTLLEKVQSCQ
ncbi:hypothetical protein OGAPHI_005365 [Ogataea philodendri]|uniref:RanBD1 domain-containing protein n=1 Tax=Ogataea philodendri TaxID=1378263 RepID=A0A9P8P147_9ASCO|nr:uncharacterized protein OGAPHI_005365 [Ogataea philodendri]KAH3663375.1 hypothetical protein OGAPHI_005365 [Ogataea philodendri]